MLWFASGCRMIMHQMKPNFFTGNGAFVAAESVKSKIGKPFRVRTIEITEDKFKMTVESPDNPRNVDEYTYIGIKAAGPNPLPFSPYDAKETDRMPIDEIDFTVVPQIVENALEKAQIEGGKVTEIMFYTRVGSKFGWDVQIKGTRESASVRTDLKGNVVGSNLSQTARAADYRVINETELNKASDAIKAKFGANAQISDLLIDEQHIGFTAKNPSNPQEVYKYSFGFDGLTRPTSMIALPESMLRDGISFNEINLAEVVNLSRRAKEKLGMPNGEINSVSFYATPVLIDKPVSDRLPGVTMKSMTMQMRWSVDIKQGADKGQVQYDTRLNEIPADKK